MDKAQQQHFDSLYHQHLINLTPQGKRPATIDAYSRAVRRITAYFEGFAQRQHQGEMGYTMVLHTHDRKRDIHPHIHIIVPSAITKNEGNSGTRGRWLICTTN